MTDHLSSVPGYRAWLVVAVLFLCVGALMGSSIYGFIIIADIMATAHSWSPTRAGGLVSAMWLVAPVALLSAPVIRRCGPWPLIVGGLILLASAFAGLSGATEFWQVYALRVVMGFAKVAIMISVPVVVAQWFDRRFGTAIAIVWAGGSAGGIVFAPWVEHLDRTAGFHGTTLSVAASIAVVALAAFATSRLKQPDEAVDVTRSENPAGSANLDPKMPAPDGARLDWTIIAAIVLGTIGLGCANIAFLAMNPHLLAGFGIDSATIAQVVGFNAAASMAGALAIGWLTDRLGIARPSVAMAVTYLAGLVLYLVLTGAALTPVAFLATTCIGIAAGAAEVLWITLLKHEASGARFAMLYGVWYFAIQVGYAIGGLIGGWTLDRFGSVAFMLVAGTAFAVTPLFALWRSRRAPDRPRPLGA